MTAQASLAVSFNDLRGYALALNRALTEPYPAYEAIGLREGEDYRQLATTLLQIENEFYGIIRPKRSIKFGERPLHALGCRGVEYVEVRCLDVNPFHPVGIDADTMRLLDIFLLHCVLSDSPPDSPREIEAILRNQRLVAEEGRDPRTRLDRAGEKVAPADWGGGLLRAVRADRRGARQGPRGRGVRQGPGGSAARPGRSFVAAFRPRLARDGAGAWEVIPGFRPSLVAAAPG